MGWPCREDTALRDGDFLPFSHASLGAPEHQAAPTEIRPLPAMVFLPVTVRNSICRDFPWPDLWLPCLGWLATGEPGPSLPFPVSCQVLWMKRILWKPLSLCGSEQ